MLAGCPPAAPQGVPNKPLITRRPGNSATPLAQELMGGSLFPHPNDPGKLELDAPLATEIDSSKTPYFAFTLHVVTDPAQTPELAWRDGAAFTPMTSLETASVSGPCEEPIKREAMRANALRQTGAAGPASYDANTDAFLKQGKPVWWLDCQFDGQGQIAQRPAFIDGKLHYDVVALLPASLAHPPTNGHEHGLSVRAVNMGNGLKSDPVFVAIERSPILIGVVGDSIAWGQGLKEDQKAYSLLTRRITESLSRPDSDTRLVVRARSGTILASASPAISIGSAGGDCHLPLVDPRSSTGADYGEVPNDNPTIPCQLQDLSRRTCQVALPDGIGSHVFSVDCHDGTPPGTAPLADVATANPAGVTFSLGARYDFLFMDGCINDLSGVLISTAPKYLITGPLYRVDPALQASLDQMSLTDRYGAPGTRIKLRMTAAATLGALTVFKLPGRDLIRTDRKSDNLSRDIRDKCTVTNAVGDLPQVIPNATIAWFGYHVFLSTDSAAGDSFPRDCGIAVCGPPGVVLPGGPVGDPLACIVGAPLVRAQAAARVEQWVNESNQVLHDSVMSLHGSSKNGSILFVPTSPPFSNRTAAFAPSSQTFGFSCLPPQGVDEVHTARETACDSRYPRPSYENTACRLTSMFHPNVAGHAVIASEIERALGGFKVAPGQ